MKLNEIIEKLNLEVKSGDDNLETEVIRGYSSDLLSDVMANAEENNLWITLHIHPNIIGVAVLKSIAGIIIVNNRIPEEEMLKKAVSENIPIMTTSLPTFEVIGRLYKLGISGI